MSICCVSQSEQAAISSGSGSRFCGGRHLITLAMNTSVRFRPMLPSSCLEELPGSADERPSLLVFVVARRLTDQHDVCVDRPSPGTARVRSLPSGQARQALTWA